MNARQKAMLAQCDRKVATREGKCRTRVYKDDKTPMEWECKRGHIWKTPWGNIRAGRWCHYCAPNARVDPNDLVAYADSKGGGCDISDFRGVMYPIIWWCEFGHRWPAIPNHIKDGKHWCPTCGGTRPHTIEVMQDWAAEKRGRCLSPKYINQLTKLKWECEFKHVWMKEPCYIRQGVWCPYCRHKNEDECRRIIERLASAKFDKCRPRWLKGLELDGYCEKLAIAFEYQGEQHYNVVRIWHKNGERDLKSQQQRDAAKLALCQKMGVELVVIPCNIRDKSRFISAALDAIYQRRAPAKRKTTSAFTVTDDDPIWAELGL